MKQARGAGGLPGADEDDFSVVPVESTSESMEHFEFRIEVFNPSNHSYSTLSNGLTMHRG